nr:uncharacterized protein LOC124810399 isoform X2 [Hydra vulgaris]
MHNMLKKSSILQLCNCIQKLVYEEGYSGTNVHLLAVDISNKYKQIFNKFAQCYKIFASRSTPEDLALLIQYAQTSAVSTFCATPVFSTCATPVTSSAVTSIPSVPPSNGLGGVSLPPLAPKICSPLVHLTCDTKI